MRARTRSAAALIVTLAVVAGGWAYFKAGDIAPQVPEPKQVRTAVPQILALGDPLRVATPAPEAPPKPSRTPVMDKLSPLARYDRLVKTGDPIDAKLAYDLAQRCIDDMWSISRVPKDMTEDIREMTRQECGDLATRPGILEPTAQLALVKRAAEAGVHRAYLDLYRNHVKGSRTLPEGPETDAYMERLRQTALSTADPYALAEEHSMAEQVGKDKPAELALLVAYRTALARDRGDKYDPHKDAPTQAVAKTLPPAVAEAAIEKGTKFVAINYRSQL
jgi:hypothetical protein